MRLLLAICLKLVFLGICPAVFSQSLPTGLQIGIDLYQGQTLRHRPTMVFPLPQAARMISFEVARQTEGSQPWHHLYGYPRIGWTFSVLAYGNREVLGRAYSLHPFLDLYLLRKKYVTLLWRTSYGLAWVDRQFHRIQNTGNNAIGSHLNNHASLNLISEIRLSPRLWIRVGGTLSHNSNGSLQMPNLGLNTAKIRVGATYQLTPIAEQIIPSPTPKQKQSFLDKLQLHIRAGLAFKEEKVAQGPKYAVLIGSGHLTYQFGQKNRFQIGWEYIHDNSVQAFLQNHQSEEEIPSLRYRRHVLLFGHEYIFWRVGLMTQGFIYMNPPFEQGNPTHWGVKIGPNFYFLPPKPERSYNFFTGIYLKAHKAIAAYAELTAGMNFDLSSNKTTPLNH